MRSAIIAIGGGAAAAAGRRVAHFSGRIFRGAFFGGAVSSFGHHDDKIKIGIGSHSRGSCSSRAHFSKQGLLFGALAAGALETTKPKEDTSQFYCLPNLYLCGCCRGISQKLVGRIALRTDGSGYRKVFFVGGSGSWSCLPGNKALPRGCRCVVLDQADQINSIGTTDI